LQRAGNVARDDEDAVSERNGGLDLAAWARLALGDDFDQWAHDHAVAYRARLALCAELAELHGADLDRAAAVLAGARKGREAGIDTKLDDLARSDRDLLRAVADYQAAHPRHGLPAVAAALLAAYGPPQDHADPDARRRAVEALRGRIRRALRRHRQKSLDA
jgi:hypothetical protein